MTTETLLAPATVTTSTKVADPGRPVDQLKVKATLAELAEEYVLLAPWLLTGVSGGFDHVRAYWAEQNLPEAELPKKFIAPGALVLGLPLPADRSVLLVPKQHYAGLIAALRKVSVVDRASKTYWQAMTQLLTVPDVSRRPVDALKLDRVAVEFVVADGNRARAHFIPSTEPHGLPALRIDPPEADIVRLAAAVFGDTLAPEQLTKGGYVAGL